MVGKRAPTAERFLAKFNIGADNECWIWKANTNGAGYGLIWDKGRERKTLAHRYSFEHFTGRAIPDGALMLHSCDNPSCVNPKHLRIGTYKENSSDMIQRDRHARSGMPGEQNPNSKLSDDNVVAIRRAYVEGQRVEDIAAAFSIPLLSAQDLVGGGSWTHLLSEPGITLNDLRKRAKKNTKSAAKITPEIVSEIRARLARGELGKDIAAIFGIHKATVSDIKQRKIWRDVP